MRQVYNVMYNPCGLGIPTKILVLGIPSITYSRVDYYYYFITTIVVGIPTVVPNGMELINRELT